MRFDQTNPYPIPEKKELLPIVFFYFVIRKDKKNKTHFFCSHIQSNGK